MDRPRKHAFLVKPALDGFAHDFPHFSEIVPDAFIFYFTDVFPVCLPVFVAPLQKFLHSVERVDVRRLVLRELFASDGPASDTVECPFVLPFSGVIYGCYLHSVRVGRKEDLGLPVYLDGAELGECIIDCHIGKMAFPCRRQRAVQRHQEAVCLRMMCQIDSGRLVRTHRMAAGRTFAYPVYFTYGFHSFKIYKRLFEKLSS